MSDEIKDAVANEELTAEKQKPVTDNDEIAEFNKEVLDKLESPLIVHKKTDASYQETASEFKMNETHSDEQGPTLKRHRYKTDKKKKGRGFKAFLAVVVILVAVFAGLYYGGAISFDKPTTTTVQTTKKEKTTKPIEDKYKDTIVVRNMYIFVNGKEVDGIKGLQDILKYEDASPTRYTIIIEGTQDDFNDQFYNLEVLPILQSMKFYDESTVVKHVNSTGLLASAESTTALDTTETTSESTTKQSTTKAETTKA